MPTGPQNPAFSAQTVDVSRYAPEELSFLTNSSPWKSTCMHSRPLNLHRSLSIIGHPSGCQMDARPCLTAGATAGPSSTTELVTITAACSISSSSSLPGAALIRAASHGDIQNDQGYRPDRRIGDRGGSDRAARAAAVITHEVPHVLPRKTAKLATIRSAPTSSHQMASPVVPNPER